MPRCIMAQWIKYVGYPEDFFKYSYFTWSLIFLWLLIPLLYITYGHLIFISNAYKRRKFKEISQEMNEVIIVVLGDLGHSPRMGYHAQSFEKLGYQVNLCGYLESSLPPFLFNENISIYDIPVLKNTFHLPYLIFATAKVFQQLLNLTILLKDLMDDNTRFVLIQNPPSLPVLLIIGLLKKFWAPNVQIIVDWHNLNWSILNLKYQNENHFIVKMMKFYEKICSQKFADFNLTVTCALKNYLVTEFSLDAEKIVTVYDRPSQMFSPLKDQEERNKIVHQNVDLFKGLNYDALHDIILVSSTSFTLDEDFTVLLNALAKLEERLISKDFKYRVFMIVTGKGPLQSDFKRMLQNYKWEKVIINNLWLPIKEYPNVLKIANLGISLHYSSSGLDLPMKIVDLFGSGTPVISMRYPVITELVKDHQNGIIVKDNNDSIELADLIYETLISPSDKFDKIKQGALIESERRWDDEWDLKLGDLFSLSRTTRV